LQECSKQKDEGSGVLSQMWANRFEGPQRQICKCIF
jgi:hypothetical protein